MTPEHSTSAAGVRLVAFYLPQFHRIPENDAWWGPGFTDWTNVRRARPLYPGHYQPHVPLELGHYDLREGRVRERQAQLAAHYGIDAFCYYHYWFEGRRLLEAPFETVLQTKQPALSYCLCWANESWTRRWDGEDTDILLAQTYDPADDIRHMEALLPALADPRALRVEGRPAFVVYRPDELPDATATLRRWVRVTRNAGLDDPYFIAVERGRSVDVDPRPWGFDASLLFQPEWNRLSHAPRSTVGDGDGPRVYDYAAVWPALAQGRDVPWTRYRCVFPGWDNSPRVGDRAVAFRDATAAAYESWLSLEVTHARTTQDDPLVFINAWNEWGEGCHLEPDVRHGRSFLRATRRAKSVYAGHPLDLDDKSAHQPDPFAAATL